jgi:hypothetical protein
MAGFVADSGNVSPSKLPKEVRRYFSKIGKKGAAKGGRARAATLTPEQRSESARKASLARWEKSRAS